MSVAIAQQLQRLQEENKRYREALVEAMEVRAAALSIIEQNGFVFESIGKEPGNWQHLAFTLYTMLCEIEATTAAALTEEDT